MIDIYYSRTGSNSFVLYNEKNEGILIDPGYNPNSALVNHLKKQNFNIVAILITHGHFDHIYSLKEVCELYNNPKVYISIDEVEFLSNKRLNLSEEMYGGVIEYVPSNLITVSDNEILSIAGFEIKVIATPFHTIGSVCYYVASEKSLFSGDTLFFSSIGRTDLPGGSSKTISSSLRKLIELPNGIKVYPGHAACTELDREKKYNTYLRNI